MSKATLIMKLSEKTGVSRKDATLIIDEFIAEIRESLGVRKEPIRIHGMGTFYLHTRAPRTGTNPRTHQPIDIPGRTVPKFKPAKALKEAVAK